MELGKRELRPPNEVLQHAANQAEKNLKNSVILTIWQIQLLLNGAKQRKHLLQRQYLQKVSKEDGQNLLYPCRDRCPG